MIGVGVGYKFNDYFRTDVTFDYETPARRERLRRVCGTSCTGGNQSDGIC